MWSQSCGRPGGRSSLPLFSIKEEVKPKKIRQKKTGTRTPCFQSLGVKQEEIQIYQFAYCCRHCALKHEVGKIKYRAREKREEKKPRFRQIFPHVHKNK